MGEEAKRLEPLGCPFHETGCEVAVRVYAHGTPSATWSVSADCGATGPTKATKAGAVEAWNAAVRLNDPTVRFLGVEPVELLDLRRVLQEQGIGVRPGMAQLLRRRIELLVEEGSGGPRTLADVIEERKG